MRAAIFALLPMTETIETSLVYIHSLRPTKKFVGCGALIEGGYIATCRHVWRDAADANGVSEVEIEYPCSYEAGNTIRSSARLADPCEETGRPSPDLVLLQPAAIPSGVMALQLAAHDRFETGAGFAYARLARVDPDDRVMLQDIIADGSISPNLTSKGRQFTGAMEGYWFSRGSSGSPAFVTGGQQLAGILSLSELGVNEGRSRLKVAFLIPATTIRAYLTKRAANSVAEDKGVPAIALQPVLDALGMQDVPVAEIPTRLKQFVDGARARAAQPVLSSNDGSDVEAVIGASRDKLRALDTEGARNLPQAKIEEEVEARTRRLVPLLKERGAIERLASDHEGGQIDIRRDHPPGTG
jgi:hypothetical protein